MSRPWMPIYVADYLADTGHLSAAEHGAYLMLIMHYWANGGLPCDDRKLARIARMSDREWSKARPTIVEFFETGWTHKRIDAELVKSEEKSAAARANGSRGARSKWGMASDAQAKRSERLAAARANGSHTKEEWSAMLSAIPMCVKCGAQEHLVKDHIIPIYQGGSDGIDNIQPLCHSCNSSKGQDTTDLRPANWRDKMSAKMPGERLANASHRARVSQPQPDISVVPTDTRAGRASPSAEAAVIADEFSNGFWPEWPHKVGKPEAAKSFLRARRSGVALETIISGVRRYVADKPPDRPWLNPATFLNQRRWEDVPAAVARAGPSQPRETILTALAFGTDYEPDYNAPEPSAGPQHGSPGPAVARLVRPAGDPFEPVGEDGGRTLAGFGLTRSIGG